MTSVLFVCLGNICRSPAAEGILRYQAIQKGVDRALNIESCGLGSWHVGDLPDRRMQQAAFKRGINLFSRAKQFNPTFFERFDYILAADHDVLHELYNLAKTPEHNSKIHLITVFSTLYRDQDIPDPYYEGEAIFELVLDMLEESNQGLLRILYEEPTPS